MLLAPASLSLPSVPSKLFGREATLALEIGFGGGRFLEHLAATHPDWNLLGAELSLAALSRTFRRLRRSGKSHVRLYRGHGRFLVRDVLPEGSLHRLYVNFPDPWPKDRHHHHRLLNSSFFTLAATRLAPDGALLLTTDHQEYFRYACEEAERSTYFAVEEGPPPPAALQTKYARKWKAQQKPFFHARFSPCGAPSEPPPRRVEKVDMHHALLEGELPAVDRFEKQVHRHDERTVVLLEAYLAVGEERLLIRTIIEEPDLRQDIMVEVRPSRSGLLVGVAPFGDPLTTRGTSDAVRLAAKWLETQGCALVDEKY